MNFYPFHIGDYAAHTRHLSFMEDLAYRRLIDQYYLDENPLKGEPFFIARRIGMSDFSSDVQYILETFFEKKNDLWVSKRCDDEIIKYRAKADSARNANRIKSEKLSALKSEQLSEPLHNVTKNQEPRTNNHKQIKKIQTPDGVSVSVFKDYLEVRKTKKAKFTETALKGLQREASKAGISLEDAIRICVERNWVSFKAEWIKETKKPDVVNVLTRGLISGGSNVNLLGK